MFSPLAGSSAGERGELRTVEENFGELREFTGHVCGVGAEVLCVRSGHEEGGGLLQVGVNDQTGFSLDTLISGW